MSSQNHPVAQPNGWFYDANIKKHYRYRVDAEGRYEQDQHGNWKVIWEGDLGAGGDEEEDESTDEEEEEENREDDEDEDEDEEFDHGADSADAISSSMNRLQVRHDSTAGYDPNMAEAASEAVRNQIRIKGTPEVGWYEPFDTNYCVRTKAQEYQFFKQGRVFAMLWSEPAGESLHSNATDLTLHPNLHPKNKPGIVQGIYGQKIHCSIRRFVIIRTYDGNMLIDPSAITTYNGRGTLKKGCNPSGHAIVYLRTPGDRRPKPKIPRNERNAGLYKDPIAIIPSDVNEKWDPKSRLRLGKIYSIECNVKVRDIGMVSQEDRAKLLLYHKQEKENGFEPDDFTHDTPQPGSAYRATSVPTNAYADAQTDAPNALSGHPASNTPTYGHQPWPTPHPYQTQHAGQYSAGGHESAPRTFTTESNGYSSNSTGLAQGVTYTPYPVNEQSWNATNGSNYYQ